MYYYYCGYTRPIVLLFDSHAGLVTQEPAQATSCELRAAAHAHTHAAGDNLVAKAGVVNNTPPNT